MKKFLVVLISVITIGCQHDNSNEATSPLMGAWLTNACELNEIPESSALKDSPLPFWGKGLYVFHVDGHISHDILAFEDSSCSGESRLLKTQVENEDLLLFSDLGQEILEEGVEGGRIMITINLDEPGTIEGFYTINSGSLCFSDRLNFHAFFWLGREIESKAIDFENCLSKQI